MPISATMGRLTPVPARRNDENAILFSTSLAGFVSPQEYLAIKTETADKSISQRKKRKSDSLDILVHADIPENMKTLRDTLLKLSTTKFRLRVVAGLGGITEYDANLALTSGLTIIGFNVRANDAARSLIEANSLDLRYYSIIDEVIEDVRTAISGPLWPEIREKITGLAEVRDVFRSPTLGAIAGCRVMEGVLKRNNSIRVLRDNVVIFEGALDTLRRFKDDVSEVKANTECGLKIKGYDGVRSGDQIEGFERIDFSTSE